MGWGSIAAIYFVVWWILLFAILPIGVTSQVERGEVTPGTDPGAPVAPQLVKKAILTSIVAAVATSLIIYFGAYIFD